MSKFDYTKAVRRDGKPILWRHLVDKDGLLYGTDDVERSWNYVNRHDGQHLNLPECSLIMPPRVEWWCRIATEPVVYKVYLTKQFSSGDFQYRVELDDSENVIKIERVS